MNRNQADVSRREFIAKGGAIGVAALAAPAVLAACGGSGASGGGGGGAQDNLKGPVASDGFATASAVSVQMSAGTSEAARQLGLQAKSPNYNAVDSAELADISQLSAQGVTAVSTLILDNGITRQIAEACVRDKLYLSTWAQMGAWVVPSEPGIAYHYQGLANPPEGAYFNCVNMFKALGGKGKFVHISGAGGSATSKAKDRAVDKALRKYPHIELVARQYGNYDRTTTDNVLTNIISQAGGKIDAVYCQSDDSGTGALDALRKRGLIGKVLVAGADGIPEFIDAIIKGEAYGTEGAAGFYGGGYTVIQALDASAGHKPNPAETLMVQDLLLVDNKASAQAYKALALQANAPRSLFDYKKMSRVLHPDDWDPQWPIRTFDPDQFWTANQGIPKPTGYSLPSNYVSAAGNGGRTKVDQEFASHLKKFPLQEVARKSRTQKTVFEQLDAAGISAI